MKVVKFLVSVILLVTLGWGAHSEGSGNVNVAKAAVTKAAPREKVKFYRSVDGDTLDVRNSKGQIIRLRLLLVDTPESVKPGVQAQPYSIEAKNYMTSLAKKGNLTIAYDTGGKKDRYNRHLVYLYTGKTMINERLVYNGYARVGYIYSQRTHLNTLLKSQKNAQTKKLRIWKTKGYVNPYGEGFVIGKTTAKPTTKPVLVKPTKKPVAKVPTSKAIAGAPKTFKNCTELRKYYPYGVTSKHPAYAKKHDRDKDMLACEKN